MANKVYTSATYPGERRPQELRLLLGEQFDVPLWKSLAAQINEKLYPTRRPPLRLTSRPVPVREIWGSYNYKKRGLLGSTMVHLAVVSGLIFVSLAGAKAVKQAKNEEVTALIAPDPSTYMPISQKKNDTIAGGGGGGDRDKLQAPKGRLPKHSMQQLAPPEVVIRNEHPKLVVEPTVVIPPQVHLASNHMPNLGIPVAAPLGPPSNGTGSGGGIGSGSGGGVGQGKGPGVGPGEGGGIGGGVFRVGGGISAPRPIFSPDPEYTEQARKAKYQGTCVLWMVIGPDGRPRDIKVQRTLGMGLDQKAIEAVRQWRFEPARKDGQPVAVQISVEVYFKLY